VSGAFDELLRLQEHDTALSQLRHRHSTLPERAALTALAAETKTFDASTAEVQERRDRLAREQKRIEDEVATVESKAEDVDKTLYSGSVTSPRELQAFQDDLQALRRRQAQLEDQVIDLMEQVEPLDAELAQRAEKRQSLIEQAGALSTALTDSEKAIDREIATAEAERDDIAAGLAPEVIARYERLRADLGGIAVARLVGTNCGGCHLTLSAVELDRIRKEPPDAIVQCEECDRILVR
jgi:uncharacterized protein